MIKLVVHRPFDLIIYHAEHFKEWMESGIPEFTVTGLDGIKDDDHLTLNPGTYMMERIPNPEGFKGNWIVLFGTAVGAGEMFIRDWADSKVPWVSLYEDGKQLLPINGFLS